MNTDAKLVLGAIGLVAAFIGTSLGITQYNTVQERKLREKEVENKKLYYSKLTPEQVENLEKQKLEVEKARIELKSTEAELKKTVADFKNDIQQQVETKAMSS